MTRFVTLATAGIVAATPLVAEQPTAKVNQPTSPVYSEYFPPEDAIGSAGLIGSEVYTTNRGMDTPVTDVSEIEVAQIGEVEDVLMNANGNMSGILVEPVNASDDDLLWFFPASQVTVVEEVDGPRYMIGHTEAELRDLETVDRDDWS